MLKEKHVTRLLAALAVELAFASSASAGWLTFRNDSARGVVVLEVTKAPDGALKRGRPTRLLPGETLREFHTGPMNKWVEVYDMQAPGQPIYSGRILWVNENQIFSISNNGKAATVTPAVPKITLPVNLPGGAPGPKKT